jgi:hypothetical protein
VFLWGLLVILRYLFLFIGLLVSIQGILEDRLLLLLGVTGSII